MANEPKRHRSSVGHDGKSKAFAKAGEPALAAHHGPAIARGMEAQQHTTATLGKAPKPKGYPVSVHNGMATRSRNSGAFELGGHLASYDANPANPLNAGAPAGKRLTPAAPVPGQRSRITDTLHAGSVGENHARGKGNTADMHELGAAILREATCAPDDAQALASWAIGTLPEVVGSK
jgi:hypothetical protein